MNKILTIIILSFFLNSNTYSATSWFEIKNIDGTNYFWNIKKADEIGPGRFKIPFIISKTSERLEYEKFLVKKMVPYCGKKPGKYIEPVDFLINGEPTIFKRKLQYIKGVEKSMLKSYQKNPEDLPSGMSLEELQFHWYGNYVKVVKNQKWVAYDIPYEKFKGYFPVFCTTDINNHPSFKVDFTEDKIKIIINENIRNLSKEESTFDYYDCRKKMSAYVVYDEVNWIPVRKNTYKESYLIKICKELGAAG